MRRPPRAGVAVAVASVALLAVATLGPAVASSPPRPACPACGGQFERAADEHGADVAVRQSRVLVQVHANGSATWTMRNRLNTTDGLNGDGLDRTARELADGYGPPDDATLRDARLEADVAVVVLHDPDAAQRHAGLLVVDYLNTDGDGTGVRMNADVFRVRGPPETVVTNTPAGAVEDGRTATWTGTTGETGYAEGPYLDGSPRVVVGPASARGLHTDIALALSTLPVVVGALGRFVLLQTLLFAGVLGGVAYAVRARDLDRGPTAFGAVLAAVGVGGVLLPGLANGPGWVSVPALAAVAIGLAATRPTVRERRWPPRRLAAGAGVGLAVASVALFTLEHAIGAYAPRHATARSLALALPFAACLPLGAALGESRRTTLAWGGVAVLAFVAMTLALVDPVDPPSGLGGGLLLAFLSIGAVAMPVVGGPVIALGRALAAPAE